MDTSHIAENKSTFIRLEKLSLTFLDQLCLMDMIDLFELSKGLSKIGANIFESLWFKLRTSKSPFTSPDKHGSVA